MVQKKTIVIIILVVLILFLGLYPKPYLYYMLFKPQSICSLEVISINDGPAKSSNLKQGDFITSVDNYVFGTKRPFFDSEDIVKPFAEYSYNKNKVNLITSAGKVITINKNFNERLGISLRAQCKVDKSDEGLTFLK